MVGFTRVVFNFTSICASVNRADGFNVKYRRFLADGS